MKDEAEQSNPSTGSVGWRSSADIRVRLRAWRDNPHFRALGYGSFGTKAADDIAEAADEIARLRLTDAEREEVQRAREELLSCIRGYDNQFANEKRRRAGVLAGILERLG